MKLHVLKLSLLIATTLVPSLALAQTTFQNIPGAAQPGRTEQNLNLQEQRPDVGGTSVITTPDDSSKKPIKGAASFTLKSVGVENNTAFTKDELAADYKPYIGQKVSLATLNEIAGKITARYRNAGYILSRAVVPPQRIAGGNVKIRIVEGFVDKVVFENAPSQEGRLQEYAEKIRTAKPLDAKTLERYLLLMEDLPGIAAQAVLRPSAKTPGASDVIITITEKTVDGSVAVDNRGSRYIGPYQGSAIANFNNLLGVYDRTTVRGLSAGNPKEQKFGQISHEQQLDDEGTKGSFTVGRALTQPGYRLKQFDIKGVDTSFAAGVSHPFIRSRQENLYGNAQFEVRNTDTDSLGVKIAGDRLRVLRAGSAYDFVDTGLGINRIEGQLSKGFGWWDTSTIRSRANGQTNFVKGTAQASRLQQISGPFGLFVAATGQVSDNALLSAEQFGIGGANFGSAYDPSELTGDSGAAGRVELQYTRSGDIDYIPTYQFYGFYDIGKVWTRNPSAGTKDSESLASAGGGVRFNILDPISGSLEVAVPLTKRVEANNAVNHGDDPRIFFSLAYRY